MLPVRSCSDKIMSYGSEMGWKVVVLLLNYHRRLISAIRSARAAHGRQIGSSQLVHECS